MYLWLEKLLKSIDEARMKRDYGDKPGEYRPMTKSEFYEDALKKDPCLTLDDLWGMYVYVLDYEWDEEPSAEDIEEDLKENPMKRSVLAKKLSDAQFRVETLGLQNISGRTSDELKQAFLDYNRACADLQEVKATRRIFLIGGVMDFTKAPKASDVIAALQGLILKHGDLPICADDPDTDWRMEIGIIHKRRILLRRCRSVLKSKQNITVFPRAL